MITWCNETPGHNTDDEFWRGTGVAWSKSAVRTILTNPRYTGRQVWNKQRKDDVLINVEDVALGHVTKMRWNHKNAWIWSADLAHQPLIDIESFTRAQEMLAGRGVGRNTRERIRVRRPYILRGLVYCGVCRRRMQGQWNHDEPYYRCRFPNEYGLANKIGHPRNVYLAERDVLPPIDNWLATVFEPQRLQQTIATLCDAPPDLDIGPAAHATASTIKECDDKLARYRAALEAGTDPTLIARWTAQVQAQRARALARSHHANSHRRMSKDEIQTLLNALGDIPTVLADANPQDKAEIYQRLGMQLTYEPEKRTVQAKLALTPHSWGYGSCPRGDLTHNPTLVHRTELQLP